MSKYIDMINEINTWEEFFHAVKLMRVLQKMPCLASERERVEKKVDIAIASHLSRVSETRQLQFALGEKNE